MILQFSIFLFFIDRISVFFNDLKEKKRFRVRIIFAVNFDSPFTEMAQTVAIKFLIWIIHEFQPQRLRVTKLIINEIGVFVAYELFRLKKRGKHCFFFYSSSGGKVDIKMNI